MYEVSIDGKDVIWHRHANQLRTRFASSSMTNNSSATTNTQAQATELNQIPCEPRVY